MKAPAFQFYPKDWLTLSVQRMSLEAQGASFKIMCFMWSNEGDQCSVDDNSQHLAQGLGVTLDRWMVLRAEIQHETGPLFEEKGNRLVSSMLRQIAAQQRRYRKLQSEKGKKSAQARLNRGSTAVEPHSQPEGNSSSSSSLNSHRERKPNFDVNGHWLSFEIFWHAYPKKEGKGACRQWWAKHMPDDVLLGIMLAKIQQARQTRKWEDDDGKFIPMPATWLHQERWEDEYIQTTEEKERIPL